jgi:hypothetical protein
MNDGNNETRFSKTPHEIEFSGLYKSDKTIENKTLKIKLLLQYYLYYVYLLFSIPNCKNPSSKLYLLKVCEKSCESTIVFTSLLTFNIQRKEKNRMN